MNFYRYELIFVLQERLSSRWSLNMSQVNIIWRHWHFDPKKHNSDYIDEYDALVKLKIDNIALYWNWIFQIVIALTNWNTRFFLYKNNFIKTRLRLAEN